MTAREIIVLACGIAMILSIAVVGAALLVSISLDRIANVTRESIFRDVREYAQRVDKVTMADVLKVIRGAKL